MSTQDYSVSSHEAYDDNPILFESYVGKKVKITMKDNSIHTAVLYTVDPVSESFVLFQPGEKSTSNSLKIILNHSIKNIEVTGKEKQIIPELFVSTSKEIPQTMIEKRKYIIKELLLKKRFHVVEKDDNLCVADILSIEPPYDPKDCKCTNSIILSRIQNILASVKME